MTQTKVIHTALNIESGMEVAEQVGMVNALKKKRISAERQKGDLVSRLKIGRTAREVFQLYSLYHHLPSVTRKTFKEQTPSNRFALRDSSVLDDLALGERWPSPH
jgi:hypothetical protein